MKKIPLIILGLFFISFLCFAQTQNIYHNVEGHFSFVIPDGWEEIPKSDLTDGSFTFDTGFNKISNKTVLCYVSIDKTKKVPEEEILDKSMGYKFNVEEVRDSKIILSNFKMYFNNKTAVYDKTKKMLIIFINNFPLPVSTGVSFFSNYGFVTILFYCINIYDNIADFSQIIDSFSFDKGYGY